MGEYVVKVVSNNDKVGVVASIKTEDNVGARCYSFFPGDRLVLGVGDDVWWCDAPAGQLIRKLQGPASVIWDLAPSPDGRYLLGAFNDQTLRVWNPAKRLPLLSLFVAGADWIAWTEEGYYAASPAGEKLMGWEVNDGLDRLGAFHPAAEFHKAFYRPDIIQRILAEGSVEKARGRRQGAWPDDRSGGRGAGAAAGGESPRPGGGPAGQGRGRGQGASPEQGPARRLPTAAAGRPALPRRRTEEVPRRQGRRQAAGDLEGDDAGRRSPPARPGRERRQRRRLADRRRVPSGGGAGAFADLVCTGRRHQRLPRQS